MIDYEYPDIFLGTAVQKDLLITDGEVTVEDNEYTVTDETVLFETQDFETEAFELYQSVNSSEQITWGSCETGKVSFIVRKRYIDSIIGTKLKVYIIPDHDASKMLQLGVFKVAEDKQSDNYNRHSITAYDAMYDVLNANVTDWYDDILQDEESYCTLGDLWYTFLNQFGLESADGDNYFNDDLIIRRTIEKDRISGAEIIKAICELNGAFGVITNEGKFRFKGLRPDIFHSLDTYELDVPQYMDISFEDTPFRPIKKVKVITDKGNATSTQTATGKYNTYTIAYNPLIADYSGAELQDLANGMCELLGNHSYIPCTITALGNPVMEVGDNMIVWTKYGYGIMTYIFERRLRGIQALRDTYTTSGSEYLTERLNDSASQYSQLSNEIAQATQAAIVAASTDFVETIRNIGFRLLDEPTDVSVEYDEVAEEVQIKWTDPADIATNEPTPATWAGTVVVRKEGSAPRHRWDGVLITDSTTRNAYSIVGLVDNTIIENKTYYYGIFPYHIALDDATAPIKYYRYTKIVSITIELESSIVFQAVATVNGLVDQITGESAIIDAGTYTYDNATQAIKADTYSDLHFAAPPALTEITNEVKQITFEAEVMQYADTAGSLSHDFDFTLWKPITSTFYNGTDDPPGVSQDIAMYDDFGNHVAHEAPLDSNIGQFHILKYVHTLNNGKITHLTVYMDNAVFYDTDLNINLSVLTIARIESKAVEYSYIKSIKIGVEY